MIMRVDRPAMLALFEALAEVEGDDARSPGS
jgi:hypothetical protein